MHGDSAPLGISTKLEIGAGKCCVVTRESDGRMASTVTVVSSDADAGDSALFAEGVEVLERMAKLGSPPAPVLIVLMVMVFAPIGCG